MSHMYQIRKGQTMEAEKQRIRSRHTALMKMDENYEWYKEGVRAIMRGSESPDRDQTGIHGLVADVIEVQPSYEDAAEAALGEALQYRPAKKVGDPSQPQEAEQ